MTEHIHYISELIGKYLENTLSPEESVVLDQWANASEKNRRLLADITDQQQLAASLRKFYQYDPERISRRIGEAIPGFETAEPVTTAIPPVHRVHFLRKWGWAAAGLLLFAAGTTYYLTLDKQSEVKVAATPKTEILPGRDGAILTLADGRQVVLDSLGNGIIARQSGSAVKLENGRLVYDLSGDHNGNVLYNTMTTPKGRQFQVTLPDGTRVWLNAASSIRYPTVFTGTERKVEVTGEAYFEIAGNSLQPFRVEVSNQAEIEVLGTRFNVNAYENERSIAATLLDGSVKLTLGGANAPGPVQVLKPGQQARIAQQIKGVATQTGKNQSIELVTNPNLDKVMAWKNGLFNFDGANLEEVMKQLERWYDIDVVYENGIPNLHFLGEMSRQIDLADMLEILKRTEVEFRMEEDRRLTVLNK